MKLPTHPQFRILTGFFALLMLTACQNKTKPLSTDHLKQNTSEVTFIHPASSRLNVPKTHFEVTASKGGVFTTPKGSRIEIPANALVNARGEQVNGKVDMDFREFHDATDLISSGIPMEYDSAGKVGIFQTAGMMEIRVSQNGQEVFLAEGASARVHLASYTDERDYNLYFFDEKEGNWTYLNRPDVRENSVKQELLDSLAPLPVKPESKYETSPEDFRGTKFHPDMAFELPLNLESNPELNAFEAYKWKFVEKAGYEKPKDMKILFTQVWSSIKLTPHSKKQNLFVLELRNKTTARWAIVEPVLGEDPGDQKMFKAKMRRYKKDLKAAKKRREKESKRLQNQADLVRTFSIEQFGIYNCDRIFKMQASITLKADFEFDHDLNLDKQTLTVFLVCGNDRAVIPYSAARNRFSWANFSFSSQEQNKLIAILPDDKVAVFGSSEFNNINLQRLQTEKGYTFRMRTLPDRINGIEDMRKIILSI